MCVGVTNTGNSSYELKDAFEDFQNYNCFFEDLDMQLK
jgi:hypothetical protein